MPVKIPTTPLHEEATEAINQLSNQKSNGELRKQFITSGSVQLNGEKLTDPGANVSPAAGDVLKLSKKHALRFV